MLRMIRRGFTLVEILIVVVILGILASIVVPQFASATEQAQHVATLDQLNKLRKALALYYVQESLHLELDYLQQWRGQNRTVQH